MSDETVQELLIKIHSDLEIITKQEWLAYNVVAVWNWWSQFNYLDHVKDYEKGDFEQLEKALTLYKLNGGELV